MAEIDPVVLELRADLLKYQGALRKQAADTERQLGRQEKAVQRLEKQMLRSSTAISGSLRGLAGTLGTYFTGRELVGMIDSFTRLQNSLRVAGLEGAKLETVQAQLLELSTRYGVGVEGLANLYGKATDAGRSFGASEAQILQLTEATSQALLITGTSAAQAQGAILGLSQALASGTVRAEEYNQINEGGLRPLLQAAAASERFGGDINKLRAAMLDGKVSSQEFFGSILAGSAQLEGQASKATLTLAGAFEALTSRLTVYVGQSAEANGVTQALAGAMQLLADNLDVIVPALAVIATMLGGRFLAGALVGGTALRSLAAYASIATTSLAGTALAARGAGAALLAAFGGPMGLAITAVTLGLGYLATQSADTARSLSELESELAAAEGRLEDARAQAKAAGVNIESLSRSSDAAAGSFSAFTSAVWAGVDAMTSAAKAAKDLTLAKIALSSAEARSTIAELSPRARLGAFTQRTAKAGGYEFGKQRTAELNEVSARLNVAAATLRANAETEKIVTALGDKFKEPKGVGSAAPAASEDKKKKAKGGSSGPSIADIDDRFQSELASIGQQTLSARQQLATSAEDRAELELRAVEAARTEALRSMSADKDYSQAQKARIRDALENLAEFERERVLRDKRLQIAEEAADLADAQFRAQSDALRQQYDLAKSQAERRDLAYDIIALEYQERDAALERIKNNKDLSDAVRERAAIEQAALREAQGRTMESARRDTAGPLENYFDNAKKDAAELNEAYESIAVDGLGSVRDALTDTAAEYLKLGGVAGKVINSIIADLIRLFIQQQITGLVGSLFGAATGAPTGTSGGMDLRGFKAGGGPVSGGSLYRINENATPGNPEYFRPTGSGDIIPLGQMSAMAARSSGQGGGVTTVRLALSGDIDARIDQRSAGVAIEVVRATAPTIIEGAAQETQRRMSRPRMPGAGR